MPRIVDDKAEGLFTGTNDQFLNTTPNKEASIRLISDKLCQNGCEIVQASGDADIDIVEADRLIILDKIEHSDGEDADFMIQKRPDSCKQPIQYSYVSKIRV